MSECRPTDRSASDGDSRRDEQRDPTVEAAVERIRERGETVRDRQVERALSTLDLAERERAVIEALGDRLVERLLAVPEEQLRSAAREDDENEFERALELFG